VAYIPVTKARLGLDDRTLGFALLALSVGGIVSMQGVGRLVARLGSRTATRLAAVLTAAALVLPGLAVGPAALAGALALFGAALGLLEVTMNSTAAEVERRYRRPVMAAFHAVWSLANMAGVGVGGLAIRAGWPAARTLLVGGAGLAVLGLLAGGWLPAEPARTPAAPPDGDRPGRGRLVARRRLPGLVWLLGALAFASFVCEGAVADWAGVHLRDTLGATPGAAAWGYAAYSAAMTVGRLVVDRVAGSLGSVAVLRYGGGLAALGVLGVVTAADPAAAVACWAVVGIGLSGVVPQLFTAAAALRPTGSPADLRHADSAAALQSAGTPADLQSDGSHADLRYAGSAAALGRVASLGYLGTVLGPAGIGLLAGTFSLDRALLALAVLAGLVCAGAGAVGRSGGPGPSRHAR
jgi:predicted MFS family arabinose efflux permease